jgi:hypothetical protein
MPVEEEADCDDSSNDAFNIFDKYSKKDIRYPVKNKK